MSLLNSLFANERTSADLSRPPPQRHHHHRRHESTRFPPEVYTDLTRTDMDLLAPIFLPSPYRDSKSRAAHDKQIKKRIAALPRHLQSSYSVVTPWCGVHGKLCVTPLRSIFNALRVDIEDGTARTWRPLASEGRLSNLAKEMVEVVIHTSVIWLGPQIFSEKFKRQPRRVFTVNARKVDTRCIPCMLTSMADSFDTLLAIAACFIGRKPEGIWEKSKRIQWLEAWICACVVEGKRRDAARLMWDCGKAFKKSLREARNGFEEREDDEGMGGVGGLASPTARNAGEEQREEVPEMKERLSRPHGEPWQDPDVGSVRSRSREEAASTHLQRRIREPESFRRPTTQSELLHPCTADTGASARPRPASSVYSRDIASRRNTVASRDDVDSILDLYRRSTLLPDHFQVYSLDPAEDPSVPPVPQMPMTATFATPTPQTPPPVPERNALRDKGKGKKPRLHDNAGLENVTIPRKSYYGVVGVDESEFSKQWREMLEGRAPALRVSKRGEVKGPYDADSIKSRDLQ